MNPIILWLNRAQSEFSSPQEMRDAANKMDDSHAVIKNSKNLLLNRAAQWGARKLAKKHDKHWSK